MNSTRFLPLLLLVAIPFARHVRSGGSEPPRKAPERRTNPIVTVAPAPLAQAPNASREEPAPARTAPSPETTAAPTPPATRIDPGTPERFLASYLVGFTPAEIRADGTQVFHGIPSSVRGPDGEMRPTTSSLRLTPVPALPVLERGDPPGGPGRR